MANVKAALTGKCPRCLQAKIFKNKSVLPLSQTTDMLEKCPVCAQKTELEVGFYYGTGYLSYALTVGLLIASFVIGVVLFGVSFRDDTVLYLLGVDIVLIILIQPWLMRFSRVLYLSFFVPTIQNWTKKSEHFEEVPTS